MFNKNAVIPPKILKVFLGISNTNAVIPPEFYKIKIQIICTVPLEYF
jgi:hypothetical protein